MARALSPAQLLVWCTNVFRWSTRFSSSWALPRLRGVVKRCHACSDFRLPAENEVIALPRQTEPAGPQECLNQRTFSADNHLRKAFEPFALRNFRVGCKPIGKLTKLISRNFPFSDSIEQMIQQCRRKVWPPNLRHLVGDRRSRG